MAIQIIICVESDKRAQTDNVYIKETLNRFYIINNQININYVNMGGKSKYNSKDTKKQIKEYLRDYKLGKSVVVLCVDTDQIETNYEQKIEFDQIKEYAKNNQYELVWFCHDVEEVYIGKTVSKDIKKNVSIDFKKKNQMEAVDAGCLKCSSVRKGRSNILLIFDKYLERKL